MAAAFSRATLATDTELSACVADLFGSARVSLGARVRDVAGCALKPLRAERGSFTATAGDWDISKWLPSGVVEGFLDLELLRRDNPPTRQLATVCGPRVEWIAMVHRVDAAGGLVLADESEVPRGHAGTHIKSGYFAIHKDATSVRWSTR